MRKVDELWVDCIKILHTLQLLNITIERYYHGFRYFFFFAIVHVVTLWCYRDSISVFGNLAANTRCQPDMSSFWVP